jgi:hypothetical protein
MEGECRDKDGNAMPLFKSHRAKPKVLQRTSVNAVRLEPMVSTSLEDSASATLLNRDGTVAGIGRMRYVAVGVVNLPAYLPKSLTTGCFLFFCAR